MKASETQFLKFLDGTKQFVIPIYQRTYSWTITQCAQLWEDVERAATNPDVAGHFVGSIVYIEAGIHHISSVTELLVIDGQQRLTTLSLLLAALGRALEAEGDEAQISRRRIFSRYLTNDGEDGTDRYKLLLTQSDRDTLIRVIDGKPPSKDASPRILENYGFFEQQIASCGHKPSVLYTGVAKLLLVDISLDRSHDNPQLIFESLNSTGLALSQADLIRNYVLMGLPAAEQNTLYADHWLPMERAFAAAGADASGRFDQFVRDFLTIKTGSIPRIGSVYAAFKAYAQSPKAGTIPELVADLHRYADYFVKIALLAEEDSSTRAALRDINDLKVDVAYQFILEAYADLASGTLERADLIRILRLIESYVFRRAICDIPTNTLNKTFATLAKEVDKKKYVESVTAAFLLKDSYRRFPSDEEFKAQFVQRDVYNLNRRTYLLRKLENFGRKEPVNVEEYTIEHIMPQNPNLSRAWREELGDGWRAMQSKYLHTIGNLTLTGYNPELSDRPFVVKRDKVPGGFADSPLRLNRDLAKLDHWNEVEIVERGHALAGKAAQIWPAAYLPSVVLEHYRISQASAGGRAYTLADHPHLVGPVMELFQHLRTRVLNLHPSVTEEILKLYIAYKAETNFVDVVPQASGLRLSLNIDFADVEDPLGLCKDVSSVGRWGNGNVEVKLTSLDNLDNVVALIRQALASQLSDAFDGT